MLLFSPAGLVSRCACRSCRSYLEILGIPSGHFAGCSAGLWKGLTKLRWKPLKRYRVLGFGRNRGAGSASVLNWFKPLAAVTRRSPARRKLPDKRETQRWRDIGNVLAVRYNPCSDNLQNVGCWIRWRGIPESRVSPDAKWKAGAQRRSKTHSAAILQDKVAVVLSGPGGKSIRRKPVKWQMAPEAITPKTINRSRTAIPVPACADSAKLS